ncbi:MAG TPA: NUDIX domain-containing protein [Acidimicrobiales bacterium]|nr:NUDIX domain-containing protein [Acidimicrobiales bacterium]
MSEINDLRRYEAWSKHHIEFGESALIPAATVVVMRDGSDGLEVLMLRKNSKIAFGGMWVFPGGRVDDEDEVIGDKGDLDELATASKAAVREAEEEADISIDPDSLVWFSHWVPPPIVPKRFSTFFFATKALDGDKGNVVIDNGEITDHAWMQPSIALQKRDNADIELAPPTWISLTLLSSFHSVHNALEELDKMNPIFYRTHMAKTDGGTVAMWEGDAGYETNNPDVSGSRHRLTMFGNKYFFEQSSD